MKQTGTPRTRIRYRRAFAPAGNSALGAAVALAGRGTAVVVAKEVLRAEDGEPFTTYNFSVAGDRTYFVGEAGLWVHNSGEALCLELAAKYRTGIKDGVDPATAIDGVIRHLDGLVAKGKQTGYNEGIYDVETNKHLGDVFQDLWSKVRCGEEDVDLLARERVWDLLITKNDGSEVLGGHGLRGELIEDHLARNEFVPGGWDYFGKPDGQPTHLLTDFRKGEDFLNLKTSDTGTGGWFRRIEEHVRKLTDAIAGGLYPDGGSVALDIRVQPGGETVAKEALKDLIKLSFVRGLKVTAKGFPQ